MPKTKTEKKAAVSDLAAKVGSFKTMFVVAPKSITPNEAAELKMKLAEVGGEYHLIKNTLFKLAITQSGLASSQDFESGQNAIVFVNDQSPEAAKMLKQFAKDTEKLEFKGGYLEGKPFSKEEALAIADLPSREQMLAQVLATMNAPVSGFVQVLAGNVRSIINVIDAYQKSKGEGAN